MAQLLSKNKANKKKEKSCNQICSVCGKYTYEYGSFYYNSKNSLYHKMVLCYTCNEIITLNPCIVNHLMDGRESVYMRRKGGLNKKFRKLLLI